jgi:hypothetical protein
MTDEQVRQINDVGCASHSDFQSGLDMNVEEFVSLAVKMEAVVRKDEREKMLDILKIIERSCNDVIECPLASSGKTLANELLYYIRVYKEELREGKDGEQG